MSSIDEQYWIMYIYICIYVHMYIIYMYMYMYIYIHNPVLLVNATHAILSTLFHVNI